MPTKLRRASVYAAGTPISSESRTTARTTSTVTMSTEPSWNSFHAEVYQLVVQPSGNQVPSQRLAKELVATEATISPTLTTNSVMMPSSSPRHTRSNHGFTRPPCADDISCRLGRRPPGIRAGAERFARRVHPLPPVTGPL